MSGKLSLELAGILRKKSTEDLFSRKILLKLRGIIPILPKPTERELTSSQSTLNRNSYTFS